MTHSKTRQDTGRIRTADEALRALDLDVKSYGIPTSQVRAFPVEDPQQLHVLAEFAASLVLARRDGRLVERTAGNRIRQAAAVNLWFVAWGSIVRARDGGLVLGSLSLIPHGDDERAGSDVALGITAELLRVVRPARIITEAVTYLRRTAGWLETMEATGGPPIPQAQKRALDRVRAGRLRPARVPDAEIAALAARYVTLYRRGVRRPLVQLAAEFGITRTQARDRINRARHELGYLTAGSQGRAGAEPTPALLEIWNHGEWTVPEAGAPNRQERKHRTPRKGGIHA